MPFILPILAIGGAVSLFVWGTKMLWTNDDSADRKVAEFLSKVPEKLKKYVANVEFGPEGLKVHFKPNTPSEVEKEFSKNVRPVNKKPESTDKK